VMRWGKGRGKRQVDDAMVVVEVAEAPTRIVRRESKRLRSDIGWVLVGWVPMCRGIGWVRRAQGVVRRGRRKR